MTIASNRSLSSPKRKINEPLGAVTKTCDRGHVYTPDAGCYRCHLERIAEKRKRDPEFAKRHNANAVKWQRANREKVSRRGAARYHGDSEYREKMKASHRKRVAKRAVEDPRYLANKREAENKRLAAIKADPARYAKYLERNRLQLQRRRARLKDCSSPGLKVSEWREICARHADESGEVLCAYCRRACKPTIDHVVPLARGGRDEPSNVVPACKPCNSSKNDRLLSEWRGRVVD